MNNALRSQFPPFATEGSLRSAIEKVCANFARVMHIEVLPAKRGQSLQCACIIRLNSVAAQTALRSKLDVVDFDGTIAFFADVSEAWTGDRARFGGSRRTDALLIECPEQSPANFSKLSYSDSGATPQLCNSIA